MKKGLLFLVGLLLLVLSVLIWVSDGRIAKAVDQTYAETYTPTEWRNFQFTTDSNSTTKSYALGPAKWSIVGSFGDTSPACGSGESCFTETWTATGWQDTLTPNNNNSVLKKGESPNTTPSYVTSATPGSFNDDLIPTGFQKPYALRVNLSGIYGLTVQVLSGPSDGGTEDIESYRSIPSGWTIAGTVTTP